MDRAPAISASPTPVPALPRDAAKKRLYLIFQSVGWGLFFVLQVGAHAYISLNKPREVFWERVVTQVLFIATGVITSICVRSFVKRRQWTKLGWLALAPRVLGTASGFGVLWTAAIFALCFGVMRYKWPDTKELSVGFILFSNWFNCALVLFGWLILYFGYQLFDRFNRSEVERLSLAASAKDAELRALKSQINPHFIFNSLNSLRALIEENPARARTAVTQLANLLRYSLQSGQLETVPLEDELRVANDYLALEQIRHEARLRVRMEIQPDTLSLPIPPLLLQTLVENAVKYGISTRPGGGEIAISAWIESGALRLSVTNPGTLAPPSPASSAASSAAAASAGRPPETSTGLGLRNAAERLRLLFGERATLRLGEPTSGLIVAEAIIPFPAQRR